MESDHVLVVTDPLLLPPAKLVTRLRELLVHTSSVVAALPVSNEAENEAQRRAVEAPDGPLLIFAGAGSGKTRVLTHRIAHVVATERATEP